MKRENAGKFGTDINCPEDAASCFMSMNLSANTDVYMYHIYFMHRCIDVYVCEIQLSCFCLAAALISKDISGLENKQKTEKLREEGGVEWLNNEVN